MEGEESERANRAQYGELDNFCFTPCHILIMYFFVFYFYFYFYFYLLSPPLHDRQQKVTNLLMQIM